MRIHPSAIIDPTAELAADVEVGPYSIIGPHCKIADGSKIGPHVVLQEYVHMGKNCQVSPGAVLGGLPQDLGFKGERSYAIIGDNAIIREGVTINRASGEDKATTLGDGSMMMAYSHLGHNCQVGTEVILANSVQLGGHVEVGDYAFIGGTGSYHQFIRIGKLAIISGFSAARQDIPPFAMAANCPAAIIGINKVGLRRRGYDLNARTIIKKAYNLLFYANLNTAQAIEAIQAEWGQEPYIQELITFMSTSQRGIYKTRNRATAIKDASREELLVEV
jgi:UDP-N-acetylglucosamine acyltransferase